MIESAVPARMKRHSRRFVAATALVIAANGCGSDSPVVPEPDPPPPEPLPTPISIPARGTAGTFDVATWNLLYFGAANQGPTDEALQLARVRDVILEHLFGPSQSVTTGRNP